MNILREYIRRILSEEPGRSYHTPNMDPVDVMEQEGFRVSSFHTTAGNTIVAIEKFNEQTEDWDEVFEKEFIDPEEAQFWMKQKAEEYQRKKFSKDVELISSD